MLRQQHAAMTTAKAADLEFLEAPTLASTAGSPTRRPMRGEDDVTGRSYTDSALPAQTRAWCCAAAARAISQAAHAGRPRIPRGSDGTGRHGDAPRRVSACTGRAARHHGCTPPSDGVLAGASRRPQAEVELGGKRPLTRSHVAVRAASDARGSRRCSVASREHASSFLPLVTGALIISLIGAPDRLWQACGSRRRVRGARKRCRSSPTPCRMAWEPSWPSAAAR